MFQKGWGGIAPSRFFSYIINNMENKNKFRKWIFITIFIIIIAFTAWYIYRDLKESKNQVPPESLLANQKTGAPAGEMPANQIQIPNLDRPIDIPQNLTTEDIQNLIREKMAKLIADLKKNPSLFNTWLQLAIDRKMIHDYEGAKEIWDYLTVAMPNNPVAFHNLGDLYGYFLKDNQKAEENFLKALEKGPDQAYIYRSVYEFYRYVMKDDAKAKDILRKGIELNPNTSQDLKNLLDNY